MKTAPRFAGLNSAGTATLLATFRRRALKYTGLKTPFKNMVPIVEFSNETCLDRGCGGQTTGTINPGVIWVGKSTQVAFELSVPVNQRSGSDVGFMLQYHVCLDDIFPSLKRQRESL